MAKIADAPKEKLNAIGVKAVSSYAWKEIKPALITNINSDEFDG